MKESTFLKRNKDKWQKFEQLLGTKANPDLLATLFIELTDDLSYAQTNYPESQTLSYLNNLTAKVHQSIYKNKKEAGGRIIKFWVYELPLLFKSVHKQLLISFIIFITSVIIGAVSTAYDENFPRLILGDAYVNMTLENIRKGDPMGVYKRDGELLGFLYIAFNNIFVSFKAFAYGMLTSIGTAFFLVFNGIMVGSFQYFFYTQNVLAESALTIWIHGTLEISAIVIAGCAGIVMGNGWLFPGTYSRMESFKAGAKKGLKIIIGLVPIFLIAAFLEGFVTRHTEMPNAIRLAIIIISLAFIIYYFIIYPIRLNKHEQPAK